MDFETFDTAHENRRRMLWNEAQDELATLRAELEAARAEVRRRDEWNAWLEAEFRGAIRMRSARGAIARAVIHAFDTRRGRLEAMKTEDDAAIRKARTGEGT